MIRVATIGSNIIVGRILHAMEHCPGLEHTTVYSRTRERGEAFAAACGVSRVHTSLEALGQDPEVDAVYIASPNLCHGPQVMQLLRAGKHVLCEKPIVPTQAECCALFDAARENDVVLMEAMRPAHSPGLSMVRELLPQIGKVRRATLQYCQYSSRYDNYRNGIIENAFNPTLANGAIMDIGVYCLFVMQYLFGTPEEITGKTVFLPNGVDGAGTVLAAWQDKICEAQYSKITQSVNPSVIQGEDGSLLLDGMSVLNEITLMPYTGMPTVYPVEMKPGGDIVYELEAFARQIGAGRMDEEIARRTCDTVALTQRAREAMGVRFEAR